MASLRALAYNSACECLKVPPPAWWITFSSWLCLSVRVLCLCSQNRARRVTVLTVCLRMLVNSMRKLSSRSYGRGKWFNIYAKSLSTLIHSLSQPHTCKAKYVSKWSGQDHLCAAKRLGCRLLSPHCVSCIPLGWWWETNFWMGFIPICYSLSSHWASIKSNSTCDMLQPFLPSCCQKAGSAAGSHLCCCLSKLKVFGAYRNSVLGPFFKPSPIHLNSHLVHTHLSTSATLSTPIPYQILKPKLATWQELESEGTRPAENWLLPLLIFP